MMILFQMGDIKIIIEQPEIKPKTEKYYISQKKSFSDVFDPVLQYIFSHLRCYHSKCCSSNALCGISYFLTIVGSMYLLTLGITAHFLLINCGANNFNLPKDCDIIKYMLIIIIIIPLTQASIMMIPVKLPEFSDSVISTKMRKKRFMYDVISMLINIISLGLVVYAILHISIIEYAAVEKLKFNSFFVRSAIASLIIMLVYEIIMMVVRIFWIMTYNSPFIVFDDEIDEDGRLIVR